MVHRRMSLALAGLLLAVLLTPVIYAQSVRTVTSAGITRMAPAGPGTDSLRELETNPNSDLLGDVDSALGGDEDGPTPLVNRTIAKHHAEGDWKESKQASRINPLLIDTFDGITHRQQRLANRGNQFSVEPPDQGLCVGNGYVLEAVNTALRVYTTSGAPASGVVDLNTFFGYPAAFVRPVGPFGPEVTDPSCLFDKQTQRWFISILTLDTNPVNGAFLGSNHLDLAVSSSADPFDAWTIYRLPVQNDGTQGTPNHNCAGGPCLGDYPHIGADRYGIYLTTNEFAFFGSGFTGSQIYALPKNALVNGASNVAVVQFNTADYLFEGNPGFTVWPAQVPGTKFNNEHGGTELFLSSLAVFSDTDKDNRLRMWALENTRSLATSSPNLKLVDGVVDTLTYGNPPKADQKPGDFPLGQCINDTSISTPFGPGCWQFLFVSEPGHNETEYKLDSSDSRMQQVFFAGEHLYGALGTAVNVGGVNKAGIAYFVIKAEADDHSVHGVVKNQDILALENNNLSYPAVAVLDSGRGAIAFTVVGDDHYPSAGYVGIDKEKGAGDIQIAGEGLGPADGFSGYKAFASRPRPRWGDYGAAATDGNNIWLASEYIGQTCTLAQYASGAIGSCGGTRTSLANWYTRISQVKPGHE